jgi:hypothetical protein
MSVLLAAAFQQAIIAGLSPETRADAERRATGGHSVYDVTRVILLNTMPLAHLIRPGALPLSEVVAIDVILGHAVFRQGDNLRVRPSDSRTLRLRSQRWGACGGSPSNKEPRHHG